MTTPKIHDQERSDKIKLAAAGGVVVFAMLLFYILADVSVLLRTVILLGVVGGAIFIAASTAPGARLLKFLKDCQSEVRKVVWPSRAETTQTTLAVIAMVIVMGLLLWLLDTVLFWLVRLLIG